ncbi:putative integrase [Acidithiobacillus caldus ATCC 51756]|uniref:Putative integrase n=1 Tax=Acidithiobacillus caldus (strain ATCC 51756 / DSM 8584 / KU) TaxID=637389 RepID=A0A059ZVC7_ACICK|nr:putative integrase [Acidithiobacillus caldus ATCC 51756]
MELPARYNQEHHHIRIRFVTRDQRHREEDHALGKSGTRSLMW